MFVQRYPSRQTKILICEDETKIKQKDEEQNGGNNKLTTFLLTTERTNSVLVYSLWKKQHDLLFRNSHEKHIKDWKTILINNLAIH